MSLNPIILGIKTISSTPGLLFKLLINLFLLKYILLLYILYNTNHSFLCLPSSLLHPISPLPQIYSSSISSPEKSSLPRVYSQTGQSKMQKYEAKALIQRLYKVQITLHHTTKSLSQLCSNTKNLVFKKKGIYFMYVMYVCTYLFIFAKSPFKV